MEVKFLDQLVCSSGLVNYARETLEGLGEKGTRAVVQSLPRAAKTAKKKLWWSQSKETFIMIEEGLNKWWQGFINKFTHFYGN